MEIHLRNLKISLISIVYNSPVQMDVDSLERQYRELYWNPIPIEKYGYHDVVAFLKERCSDIFVVSGPPSNPVLTLIVPDSLKQHPVPQKQIPLYELLRAMKSEPDVRVKSSDSNKNDVNTLNEQRSELNNECSYVNEDLQKVATFSLTENLQNVKVETQKEVCPRDVHHLQNDDADEEGTKQHFSVQNMPSTSNSNPRAQLSKLLNEISSIVFEHPEGLSCSYINKYYRERHGHDIYYQCFGYPNLETIMQLVPSLTIFRKYNGEPIWVNKHYTTYTIPQTSDSYCIPQKSDSSPGAWRPLTPPMNQDVEAVNVDCEPNVNAGDFVNLTDSITPMPLDELRNGDVVKVMVEAVYSPSQFWLRSVVAQNSFPLEHMMKEMTAYYGMGKGKELYLHPLAVRVGLYCCIFFEGTWLRTVVVHIIDGLMVKVRLVDYAMVKRVPIMYLKPLRRIWTNLPSQAIRARLAQAAPPAAGYPWPQSSTTLFNKLVMRKTFNATITDIDRQDNVLEVLLVDASDTLFCVTNELVRSGYAERCIRAKDRVPVYIGLNFSDLESGTAFSYTEMLNYQNSLVKYSRFIPCHIIAPQPSVAHSTQHAVAPYSSRMMNPLAFSSESPSVRPGLYCNCQVTSQPTLERGSLSHSPKIKSKLVTNNVVIPMAACELFGELARYDKQMADCYIAGVVTRAMHSQTNDGRSLTPVLEPGAADVQESGLPPNLTPEVASVVQPGPSSMLSPQGSVTEEDTDVPFRRPR